MNVVIQGGDGANTEFCTGDERGEFFGTLDLSPGQIVSITIAGGGGFGQPERRSAAAVARDVREDIITAAFAEKAYGCTRID